MTPRSKFNLLACLAFAANGLPVHAADVTKDAAGTDLAVGASWGGSAPTASDIATWESTSLGAGLTLDSAASWDGIKVNGALSDIDITGTGALTLGTGGIDASAATEALSISNDIVLNGNQTWTAGSSLTSTGLISGSGVLTLAGDSATVLSDSTFLTGTHQTIFTAAELGGLTLSDVTATGGLMGGAWVNNGTPLAATGYYLSNDGTTATYWLEAVDYGTTNYTKGVEIELVQSGGDITAKGIRAKFLPGTTIPLDFDAVGNNGTLATSQGAGGYGGHTTTAAFGADTIITLSGANTHSGGTTITSGGVVVADTGVGFAGNAGGSLGTGPVTINSGATLQTTGVFILGGGNITTRVVSIDGGTANIQGAGEGGDYIRTLNMTGGTLTSDSGNVYFRAPNGGGINLNSLASADSSTISTGIDLTFGNLTVDTAEGAAADDLAITGNITQNTGAGSGAKSLIKNGAGTLALSGANSFSGGVTINQGIVMARSNGGLGSGAVTLGETADDAALYLGNRADVANDLIVSAAGTGQVVIGADNSGSGANAASFTGVLTLNRPTTLSGEVSADRLAIDGQITGNVGTLTLTGGSRTTFRSTANDFTGNLVITGAGTVLQASVGSAAEVIPDGSSVTVDTGAFLQLAASGSGTETIDDLNGAGTVRTYVGGSFPGTLAVGAAGGSGDFSGALEDGDGALSVTKLGGGIQTLSGSSTYTGATLVSAGTLLVTGALGDTAVTVEAAATIGGTGELGGALHFEDGAMLNVVDLNDALLITGNVTFAGFGFDDLVGFDVETVAEGTYTLLDGANFDLSNVEYVGIENALVRGDDKRAYFNNGSLQVVVVPEPGIALLSGLGLLALLRRRRG